MLNITRKVGEKIIIGEDVVLEVMEVSGSSVRLGIRAPRSVPVYREEIWDSVREENAAAAKTAPTKLPEPPKVPHGGAPARTSVRSGARPGASATTTQAKAHDRLDQRVSDPQGSATKA
ncbi:MAG: carbon storage regulator CsrA [Solirubrobacteraceae bacterium]|nr:carbon storage regulator CsrA [Solirubrobacteraceae bacterium]